MPTRLTESSGFTLIEVMVASAILLIGVLSLMGMQMVSLTRGVDANELTLATNLAADMIERLHSIGDNNPPITTFYNGINTTNAATCNLIAQQQVKGDCTQWQALVGNSNLPGVQGTVAVAPSGAALLNANQVTVTINWTGYRSTSAVGSRVKSIAFTTVIDPK
jgi:type IV pilus assembly protein PilV